MSISKADLINFKTDLIGILQDEDIGPSSAERIVRDFYQQGNLEDYKDLDELEAAFITYLEKQNETDSSYSILQNIYNKKGHTSFKPVSAMHKLERVQTILSYFKDVGRVELDRFTIHNAGNFSDDPEIVNHRLNIYFYPKEIDPKKKTVIILAHYDVVHPEGHNVADNLASVAGVISIGRKVAKLSLPINIVIALTDAEEIVSFKSAGSKRLADKINADYFGDVLEAINIEVSARGTIRWVNGIGTLANNVDFKPVNIPFSDTSVLLSNHIPSTCIGIFTEEDLRDVEEIGHCETWGLCHSPNDKFELANKKDMNEFACWLLNYLEDYSG